MRATILLRRTEDWEQWSLDEYLEYLPTANLTTDPNQLELLVWNVKRWSQIWRPSFTALRGRITAIARKNWARLDNIDFIYNDCNNLPSDLIVFPVDDDDWFNPDVVPTVMRVFEENPHLDVVHWDNWQYQFTPEGEQYKVFTEGPMGSNGYALRGGLPIRYYINHMELHDVDPAKKHFIPGKALSIWFCHPASSWQSMHVRNFDINLKRAPRPPILDWAAGEIESAYSLISSIESIVQ